MQLQAAGKRLVLETEDAAWQPASASGEAIEVVQTPIGSDPLVATDAELVTLLSGQPRLLSWLHCVLSPSPATAARVQAIPARIAETNPLRGQLPGLEGSKQRLSPAAEVLLMTVASNRSQNEPRGPEVQPLPPSDASRERFGQRGDSIVGPVLVFLVASSHVAVIAGYLAQ